jgi:hypothetical protein
LLHLPLLTYIDEIINICQNNADLVVPSGPPNAPTGGLVVSGQFKRTQVCFFQVDGVCSSVICP